MNTNEPRTERVMVTMPEPLKSQLTGIARDCGLDLSSTCRMLIKRALRVPGVHSDTEGTNHDQTDEDHQT